MQGVDGLIHPAAIPFNLRMSGDAERLPL